MAGEAGGSVLCCKCGIPNPDAANMCVRCLCSEVDITEGLQKHLTIVYCPECESYLQPPQTWIKAELESNELLSFCLNRLTDLNKVKLIHVQFVWTEPHSKGIRVKLTVQKDVLNGVILEQAYEVEYVVQDHMCDSRSRVQANPDQWVASVQLRQHVPHHLRTFFYLEQLILKHRAAANAIRIKQMDLGVDFFFSNRNHGVEFVDFIGKVSPIKSCHYQHTFSVEICPICRDDLICLPPETAVSMGNLGPLVICTKVINYITFLDPLTLRHCFLDADQFWRSSLRSLRTSRQLVEYNILKIERVSHRIYVDGSKYVLADAVVARVSDFGKNDTCFSTRTHLGRVLKPGDIALGYDLYEANSNDIEVDRYQGRVLPYAILIKKSYEEMRQRKRGKPRSWKLKSLEMEVDDKCKSDQDKIHSEYELFLRDMEENPDLRFNISLYRTKEYQPSEMTDAEEGPLEKLFADLDLSVDDGEHDGMQE